MRRAVWGLPQAGILANKLLRKRLLPHGYYECANTPGLWKHVTRPISFTLVVDNFGVKYVGREHAEHLLFSRCTTNACKIGTENVTWEWTLVGTTCVAKYMCQCYSTSQMQSYVSNTKCHKCHNTYRTRRSNPSMEQQRSMQRPATCPSQQAKRKNLHSGSHCHFPVLCTMC